MLIDEYLFLIILFFAGAAASFINVMAGGGSTITLGIMMLLGLEPSVANGTNRIGILFGTGSAALAFKKHKVTDFKQSIILASCAIPGAIIGSIYSIEIDGILFQRIFAVVMIFILLTLIIPKSKNVVEKVKTSVWIYPAMILVGFYGGFIQVGVGFILMFFINHLMQVDLVKTNMHKTFVVLLYTIPVLLVFGINGKIDWTYALCMSVGNATGSWISVKIAVKKGEKVVKMILMVAIILMAIKFIFI